MWWTVGKTDRRRRHLFRICTKPTALSPGEINKNIGSCRIHVVQKSTSVDRCVVFGATMYCVKYSENLQRPSITKVSDINLIQLWWRWKACQELQVVLPKKWHNAISVTEYMNNKDMRKRRNNSKQTEISSTTTHICGLQDLFSHPKNITVHSLFNSEMETWVRPLFCQPNDSYTIRSFAVNELINVFQLHDKIPSLQWLCMVVIPSHTEAHQTAPTGRCTSQTEKF